MCGIAGIISLDTSNRTDVSDLEFKTEKMLNKIRHRGPDQIGIHTQPGMAIGNVRLTIVGGGAGRQPFRGQESSLVFNGEVYNFQQLAETHHLGTSQSDTAVLFAGLNRMGTDFISELNGAFSFCFSNSHSTYLVRDRFGEKPLFYTVYDGQLFFASEIKALATQVPLSLSLPALYPSLETCVGGSTIFADVFQVEAGTYLQIDHATKQPTVHQYYQFEAQPHQGTIQEQIADLANTLTDAISLRLPKELNYGTYISGGIDSSIITLMSQPSALFTYIPENKKVHSEEHFADLVAASRPNAHYIKVRSGQDVLTDLINVVYYNDGPTTTLAAYSQYRLSQAAHAHGLRVMLGGEGADEFLAGYARQALAVLPESALSEDLRTQYQPLLQKGHSHGASSPVDIYINMLNRTEDVHPELAHTIHDIFARFPDPYQAIAVCEATLSLPPLLEVSDRLNMAFGVEHRAPFLDYRVVDLAMSMTAAAKIHGEEGTLTLKYALKEAFAQVLPQEIYSRQDKVGFSSHVNDLLNTDWRQIVEVALDLLRAAYPDEPYFSIRHLHSPNKFSRWKYQVLQLAIAHLLFIENLTPAEVEIRLNR